MNLHENSVYNASDSCWKKYALNVDPDEVERIIREEGMPYGDITIHLDIYDTDMQRDTPTIIWCPGTSVYGRFYCEFLLRLHHLGYRIVAVDQIGHGKSGGARGHFTMPDLVDVMRKAITYARDRLRVSGPIFTAGSSLGGITAFYTNEMDERTSGSVCHNILYGSLFSPSEMFQLNIKAKIAMKFLPLLVKIAPGLRVSIWNYLDPTQLIDPQSERSRTLIECWIADPLVVSRYSIAALDSQMKWHPPKPIEEFAKPCLLLLGSQDSIFPVDFEKRFFDKLECPKYFALIEEGSHLVILERAEECARAVDKYLKLLD